MQQLRFITNSEYDKIRQFVEQLFNRKKPIIISIKKSRMTSQSHIVKIQGVYKSFFTVRDESLKANFTIQFFDIITGDVSISTMEEKEG